MKKVFIQSLLISILVSTATSASAVDGVLEINQTCATSTGCVSGDAAGFPVTLGTPGSYRLTSDLTVSASGPDAITVDADDVSIDLNGFTLSGPGGCSGSGPSINCACGAGMGIRSTKDRVSVRNGRINKFLGGGITIFGSQARIERIVAQQNCLDLGNNDNAAALECGPNCQVRFCQAVQNLSAGIYLDGAGGLAESNSVAGNGFGGIRATKSIVTGNNVTANAGKGIDASGGSVQDNSSLDNSGVGIALQAGATYRGNTVAGNGTGTVTGGVDMGSNSCNGATSCP